MDLVITAAKQVLQLLLMILPLYALALTAVLWNAVCPATPMWGPGMPGPQRFRKHLLAFKRRG